MTRKEFREAVRRIVYPHLEKLDALNRSRNEKLRQLCKDSNWTDKKLADFFAQFYHMRMTQEQFEDFLVDWERDIHGIVRFCEMLGFPIIHRILNQVDVEPGRLVWCCDEMRTSRGEQS